MSLCNNISNLSDKPQLRFFLKKSNKSIVRWKVRDSGNVGYETQRQSVRENAWSGSDATFKYVTLKS